MSKQVRQRPVVHTLNEYIPREDFRLCRTDGCQNAIAAWARDLFCFRCRGRKERRWPKTSR